MPTSIKAVEQAFHRARQDLAEVGLLDEGKYLDRIECSISRLPEFFGTKGFVYDHGPGWLWSLVGFRGGVIYVPMTASFERRGSGYTLLDVVRHEFAHAWYWLDSKFVDGPWFKTAFGAGYSASWETRPEFDAAEFGFEYSTTSPAEDFADTFGMCLKHRRSLDRFRGRPGFHRKLRAVASATRRAARTRFDRVRGPR